MLFRLFFSIFVENKEVEDSEVLKIKRFDCTSSSIAYYDEISKEPIVLRDEIGYESIPSFLAFSDTI